MAVTRNNTEQIAQLMKQGLNRPDEDDFFIFPEEYYSALTKAHKKIHQKISQHAPGILLEETSVVSLDAGLTYDLGDHHKGQLEVYAPPGPPLGERIPPANPDSAHFGFFVDGTTLRFTIQKMFNPLYIRWSPETLDALSQKQDHTLPAYCEDMLEYLACFVMANKTGFAGDPRKFKQLANMEWVGDPEEPSDMGILGTIKRLAANQGFESYAPGEEY